MRNAIKTASLGDALDAFGIYEAIGRAGTPSALNGLLRTYKVASSNPEVNIPQAYTKRLERILEKYGSEARARRTTASATASIIGIIGGIFFLFSNNAQFSPGTSSFNWQIPLGIVLLLIGIIGGFFYFKFR